MKIERRNTEEQPIRRGAKKIIKKSKELASDFSKSHNLDIRMKTDQREIFELYFATYATKKSSKEGRWLDMANDPVLEVFRKNRILGCISRIVYVAEADILQANEVLKKEAEEIMDSKRNENKLEDQFMRGLIPAANMLSSIHFREDLTTDHKQYLIDDYLNLHFSFNIT